MPRHLAGEELLRPRPVLGTDNRREVPAANVAEEPLGLRVDPPDDPGRVEDVARDRPMPASAARRHRRPPARQPLEPCRRFGRSGSVTWRKRRRAPSPAPFSFGGAGVALVEVDPADLEGSGSPGCWHRARRAPDLDLRGILVEVAPALPPNWTIRPSSDPSSGHLWPNPCGRGTRTTPGCCRCSRPHRGRAPARLGDVVGLRGRRRTPRWRWPRRWCCPRCRRRWRRTRRSARSRPCRPSGRWRRSRP